MDKTISVNIGGFAFIIEENAYQLLQNYLINVKSKFSDDVSEIMSDIESRIAELLKEKLANIREVVDEDDINEVITVMGQPEDFEEEGEDSNYTINDEETSNRKLFRDTDNAIIAGVCSGLAKYLGVDVNIIRVFFVILMLFFGTAFFLYVVLLILIPEAITTADKLKMSGEKVNLDSLKTHFSKLGDDINKNFKDKNVNRRVNSAVKTFVRTITSIILALNKVIGILFVIAGIVGLFFVTLYFMGYNDIIPFTSFIKSDSIYDFLLVIYSSETLARIALVSLAIVIVIPVFTFIYSGSKMVFDIKTNTYKPIKVSLGILFGVCVVLLTLVSIRAGINFADYGENFKKIENSESVGKVLYVKINEENSNFFMENDKLWGTQLMDIRSDQFALKNIDINLRKNTDTNKFAINLVESSNGISERLAIENASNIEYDIQLIGDTLFIPSYITVNNKQKFRGQWLDIYINMPKGSKVHFGDGTLSFFNGGSYHNQHHKRYVKNKSVSISEWSYTEKGIDCINCN